MTPEEKNLQLQQEVTQQKDVISVFEEQYNSLHQIYLDSLVAAKRKDREILELRSQVRALQLSVIHAKNTDVDLSVVDAISSLKDGQHIIIDDEEQDP